MCVCVRVCVCVRACMRVCAHVWVCVCVRLAAWRWPKGVTVHAHVNDTPVTSAVKTLMVQARAVH